MRDCEPVWMVPSAFFSSSCGWATRRRSSRSVRSLAATVGSHSRSASRQATSDRPVSRKNSPEPPAAAPARGRGGSPHTQPTTASTCPSASGERTSIQSSTSSASPAGALGSSDTTPWPRRLRRCSASIGPTSREGSSTTAEPVQHSRVGTASETVLKPPEPAKASAWVGPVRQGSTSNGARPPWPQVRGSAGSKARPRAPRSRSTRYASPTTMPPNPPSGPGKSRRASRIVSQSAWPWLSERARTRAAAGASSRRAARAPRGWASQRTPPPKAATPSSVAHITSRFAAPNRSSGATRPM